MYLKKERSEIYYEVRGEGEALLLIHGVITDSALFSETARILSDFYKVITYDRRGNSRSRRSGTDTEFDLREQAEDIRDLLDELGVQQAYIVGASAGAVIGQYFLCLYPERVKHLIMYEAGMLSHMMISDPEFREWSEKTSELIKKGKMNSALLRFADHLGPFDSRSPTRSEEVSLRELSNMEHAFSSEIPGIMSYNADFESMRFYSDKITIAAGEKSGDTAYVREAHRLAEIIGKKVLYYPGGHNLPYDLPEEFAVCILGTLQLRQYYEKKNRTHE